MEILYNRGFVFTSVHGHRVSVPLYRGLHLVRSVSFAWGKWNDLLESEEKVDYKLYVF
jgi:hypothetical protein